MTKKGTSIIISKVTIITIRLNKILLYYNSALSLHNIMRYYIKSLINGIVNSFLFFSDNLSILSTSK